MGIIGGLNEADLSPRENELKALSTLFSKACIVGKWSGDPEINKKLSKRIFLGPKILLTFFFVCRSEVFEPLCSL